MGYQVSCTCLWANESGDCTVLLEGGVLILRGGMLRRVALSEIAEVAVAGEELRFRVGEARVALGLGHDAAVRLATAMMKPPATLAKKLGISRQGRVLVIGALDDAEEELKAALAEASDAGDEAVTLAVVCVESPEELHAAIKRVPTELPVWVVYPKGKGTGLGEELVRELLRGKGYIDTKVASVSKRLTALRFVRRGR